MASAALIRAPAMLRPFRTSRFASVVSSYASLPLLLPAITIPSLQSLLDIFPPFLRAVPKKKTSHSRKAMRSANKGLKDKTNIVSCPGCGGPKLAHHICPACYSSISREWKAQQKELVEVEMDTDDDGGKLRTS